jgi:hypothetical protein
MLFLGLTKGCFNFVTSNFTAENPRTKNETIHIKHVLFRKQLT